MKIQRPLALVSAPVLLGIGLAAMWTADTQSEPHVGGTPAQHATGVATASRVGRLPEDASGLLTPMALAAAEGAAALAADDFAAYRKTLPGIRASLVAFLEGDPQARNGPLAEYRNGLADPAGLAQARRDFEPFSTAVADAAQRAGLHESAKLHVFQCSMSPVLGKGRWLQRSSGAKNPFFGARMLGCGTEIAGPSPKRSATEIALPPGHPPLDAATIAAFTGRQPGTTATSDGACGSCGMSKAAMAAGEPCGDAKK